MTDSDQKEDDSESLKHFDMYHFFSRKDVIMMILFILAMLGIIIWKVLTVPGVA